MVWGGDGEPREKSDTPKIGASCVEVASGDFLLRVEIPTNEDLADSRSFGFWTLLRHGFHYQRACIRRASLPE